MQACRCCKQISALAMGVNSLALRPHPTPTARFSIADMIADAMQPVSMTEREVFERKRFYELRFRRKA